MSDFRPADHNYYAFVVEGEVAFIMPVTVNIEHINAALASEPVVHLVPSDMTTQVEVGWQYVDGEFIPPT